MRLLVGLLSVLISVSVQAKDFSKVFAKVNPAVVLIKTVASQQRMTEQGFTQVKAASLGSGVIISADGLIMTASHVVNSADEVMVETVDGNSYRARVLSASKPADVALIRLEEPPANLTYVKPWDSDKVKVGEEVFVIGSPYGLTHTLTVGYLSSRRIQSGNDALMDVEFLQTDAAVNQGNSGGPLFNADGKLIGIVSHIRTQSGGSEGLGFVASINMAKRVLLEESPLWFGVEFIPVQGDVAKALNIPYVQGLLVQQVARGSFGDDLNLRPGLIPVTIGDRDVLLGGDIVVRIGGRSIFLDREGRQRIVDYLDSISVGEPIDISVIREGKEIVLSAKKPKQL